MLLKLLLATLIIVIVAVASFCLGLMQQRVKRQINRLTNEVLGFRKELEQDNEPAIIETTPQLIREKVRKGTAEPDDSAIVTTKTPQEVRRTRDAKLKEELDRVTGL